MGGMTCLAQHILRVLGIGDFGEVVKFCPTKILHVGQGRPPLVCCRDGVPFFRGHAAAALWLFQRKFQMTGTGLRATSPKHTPLIKYLF
jgi:hypothetical protein